MASNRNGAETGFSDAADSKESRSVSGSYSSCWGSSFTPGIVGEAGKRRQGRPGSRVAGARAASSVWITAVVKAAAGVFLAVLLVSGFAKEGAMRMRSIHISADAGFQTASLRASLRVALQVSQRQNRAMASNRNGAETGFSDAADSKESRSVSGS
jgi:hypothetical protein